MKLSPGSLWFLTAAGMGLLASVLTILADGDTPASSSAPGEVTYFVFAAASFIAASFCVVIGIVVHLRQPKR